MAQPDMNILTLSYRDVMRLVRPEAAMAALAEGFKALSRGDVQAPPRPKIDIAGRGFVLTMLAWAPGQPIAEKTACVFHGNHDRGLTSHQVTISLFDPDTGAPIALIEGGSITALRTTAAAMLTVRDMARADATVATVVGAGVEGVEHVRQLNAARPFREIRVFARNPDSARRAAREAPNAVVVTDLAEAVASSDVVCLTTAAATPVIEDAWVRRGTHVTSVGYAPPGSELPSALIDRARLFVEVRSAFQPSPVGCAELAGRNPDAGAQLGEVLAGLRPGRTSPDEITLFKSMGNAMEDMVVANLAYQAARASGAGQMITL